jgi:hypothetical protein
MTDKQDRKKNRDHYPEVVFSRQLLTTEQLASVGCVAVESTYLEAELEELLWKLAGMDEARGVHFTRNMQMKSRIEMLWILGRQRLPEGGEGLDELKRLTEWLKEANVERNTVIHGYWNVDAQDVRSFGSWRRQNVDERTPAFAEKRNIGKLPTKFSAANIEAVSEKIGSLRFMLTTFLLEHMPELV